MDKKWQKVYANSDINNKEWAENKTGFGYKMLQKMGWAEGKGLGTNEQGQTENVKVVKKFDARGVGADAKTMTKTTIDSKTNHFRDVLAKLNTTYKKPAKEEEEEEEEHESDSNSTGEEEEKITKKPVPKKRARAPETSSEEEEEEEEEEVKPKYKLPVKHMIYHRKVQAKLMTSFSKDDIAAIFGKKKEETKPKEESDKESSNEEEEEESESPKSKPNSLGKSSLVQTKSSVNMNEYFANKKTKIR